LDKSIGTSEEENMEVRSAVTPSRHVRASYVRQRFNRSCDMYDEPAELSCEVVRQVGQVEMSFRLQHDDEWRTRRL
jgi:hypothetical protein